MEEKDFHTLMNNTHALGIIHMYGRYQQEIYDRRTMTETPERVEEAIFLHNRCQIMELSFEKKIMDIIRNRSTPNKDKKNETQY